MPRPLEALVGAAPDASSRERINLASWVPLIAYGLLFLLAASRLWVHRPRTLSGAAFRNAKFAFHAFLTLFSAGRTVVTALDLASFPRDLTSVVLTQLSNCSYVSLLLFLEMHWKDILQPLSALRRRSAARSWALFALLNATLYVAVGLITWFEYRQRGSENLWWTSIAVDAFLVCIAVSYLRTALKMHARVAASLRGDAGLYAASAAAGGAGTPLLEEHRGAPQSAASGSSASEHAPLSSSVMLESERAFVLFAQLLEDEQYRLSELFHPSFAFYRQVLSDIDREIARREPVLFAHLEACGLTAVVYAAKWILTLFTFYCDQDFASVTNVWLRFLSDGWDAVLRIAVAVVCCVKEHLLNADAEGCMLVLSGTTAVTPHGVLEVVFGTARGQALLREQRKGLPEPDGQVGVAQQQDQTQAHPPRAPSSAAGTVPATTGSNETWSAGRSATSQLTAPLAGATGTFNSDVVELDLGSVSRGRRGDADGSSASDASSSNGGAASGDMTISAAAYLRSARVIRRTVPTRRYTTPKS